GHSYAASSRVYHCDRSRLHVRGPSHPLCPYPAPSLFHSHGHPRHLHSFPTRRSSDLTFTRGRGSGRRATRDLRSRREKGRTRPRSEEHTSELQSRVDLVCRLLLEKKNTRRKLTRSRT